MKKVCGTCNFNVESRAGTNSIESLCANDNQWRKDSTAGCSNWSERSNSLSPKDRIDIATSSRQEILLQKTSEKKWFEKPLGLILIGVIIIILGYFATEFISSSKQKSQQVQQQFPATSLPNVPQNIPKKSP